MIRQGDNSMAVVARAIRMLNELPDPYPEFGEMLRFFACIDYSRPKPQLYDIISNYLTLKSQRRVKNV